VDKVSGDERGEKNTDVREDEKRRGVAEQIAAVKLDAAFEDKRGQKQDEDDVRSQPVRAQARLKRRQERQSEKT